MWVRWAFLPPLVVSDLLQLLDFFDATAECDRWSVFRIFIRWCFCELFSHSFHMHVQNKMHRLKQTLTDFQSFCLSIKSIIIIPTCRSEQYRTGCYTFLHWISLFLLCVCVCVCLWTVYVFTHLCMLVLFVRLCISFQQANLYSTVMPDPTDLDRRYCVLQLNVPYSALTYSPDNNTGWDSSAFRNIHGHHL